MRYTTKQLEQVTGRGLTPDEIPVHWLRLVVSPVSNLSFNADGQTGPSQAEDAAVCCPVVRIDERSKTIVLPDGMLQDVQR